jgi:hypothetical protein
MLLLVPALWATLIDILCTIIFQSNEYWQGNLQAANEANPIGAYMMQNHVSGIYVISIVWLVLIGLLGYYLPKRLSRIFLVFILIVHSWAGCSWIDEFWFKLVFIGLNTMLFCWVDEIVDQDKSQVPTVNS